MAQLMVNAVMAGEGNSTSWIKQKNDCYSPFAKFCASTRETGGEDGDFNPTHPPMMPAHELPSLDTSPDPSLRCSSPSRFAHATVVCDASTACMDPELPLRGRSGRLGCPGRGRPLYSSTLAQVPGDPLGNAIRAATSSASPLAGPLVRATAAQPAFPPPLSTGIASGSAAVKRSLAALQASGQNLQASAFFQA